jgi:amidase
MENTAADIAARVRSGHLSPREVLDACLSRIATADPRIGAFQLVDAEGARRAADALTARPDLGHLPLAGVPVAVKDNLDVAGLPTRHGSAATPATESTVDDPMVARLRAAGAVIVGKTRMPELAIWPFTESKAFGGTRNPRDPSRNAGGSTGGAAAVAAGMVPLTIGSDGGGSLRIPAANCGVVGFKPGRLLASGHWYGCTAYGPVAATVADAALALAVLSGEPVSAYDGPPLRYAVSTRSPSPLGPPDSVARTAVASAASLLRTVTPADPPYPATLINQWVRYWHAGVAREVQERELDESRLEPRTRAVLSRGRKLIRRGLPRLSDAAAWRERMLDWFGRFDVLLTPVVAKGAPPAGWGTDAGYLRSYLHGARCVPYTQPWNLAGFPALSLPIGGTPARPGAVQLVAVDESTLLAAAAELERLRDAGRDPIRVPG